MQIRGEGRESDGAHLVQIRGEGRESDGAQSGRLMVLT